MLAGCDSRVGATELEDLTLSPVRGMVPVEGSLRLVQVDLLPLDSHTAYDVSDPGRLQHQRLERWRENAGVQQSVEPYDVEGRPRKVGPRPESRVKPGACVRLLLHHNLLIAYCYLMS